MTYSVEIISREKQDTSTWAGGTTTQLAIYPPGSEYKTRNFKWRLSSACVEIDESMFTSLPGIWRHIMIIDGKMELRHDRHHSILLGPFEKDSFDGGWTTRSIGKARDFNLMLSSECKGELEAIFAGKDLSVEVPAGLPEIDHEYFTDAFYCASGAVKAIINKEHTYSLYQGDLMLIESRDSGRGIEIALQGAGEADAAVIRAKISYR